MLGAGYFINWLVPVISLPVAFALAAVLSPTDAVALGALTGRMRVPERLMNILRGESLLNDASGLVAFKFALGAALTGVFVLKDALVSFLFIAAGGLLVGALLSGLVSWVRHRFVLWKGEMGSAHIVLSLLLPFGSYLIAEHLGFSGILAAVSAGMMMNVTTFNRNSSLATRIQSVAIWGMIEMAFNGGVFLLLGVQLPDILRTAPQDALEAGTDSVWVIVGYVVAITAAVFALRFLWVWLSLQFFALVDFLLRKKSTMPPNFRLITVTTMAGVRGAVTLAAVLSLPIVLPEGGDFPARNLLIFLATGTILLSLFVASVGLPLLLRTLEVAPKTHAEIEEEMARVTVARAGVTVLQGQLQELASEESDDRELRMRSCRKVIGEYQLKIETMAEAQPVRDFAIKALAVEKSYRLQAVRSERSELIRLYDTNKISNRTLEVLSKDVDLREGALTGVDIEHF